MGLQTGSSGGSGDFLSSLISGLASGGSGGGTSSTPTLNAPTVNTPTDQSASNVNTPPGQADLALAQAFGNLTDPTGQNKQVQQERAAVNQQFRGQQIPPQTAQNTPWPGFSPQNVATPVLETPPPPPAPTPQDYSEAAGTAQAGAGDVATPETQATGGTSGQGGDQRETPTIPSTGRESETAASAQANLPVTLAEGTQAAPTPPGIDPETGLPATTETTAGAGRDRTAPPASLPSVSTVGPSQNIQPQRAGGIPLQQLAAGAGQLLWPLIAQMLRPGWRGPVPWRGGRFEGRNIPGYRGPPGGYYGRPYGGDFMQYARAAPYGGYGGPGGFPGAPFGPALPGGGFRPMPMQRPPETPGGPAEEEPGAPAAPGGAPAPGRTTGQGGYFDTAGEWHEGAAPAAPGDVPNQDPAPPGGTSATGSRGGQDGVRAPDARAAGYGTGNNTGIPDNLVREARRVARMGPAAIFKYMHDHGHPRSGAWCGEFAAAVMQSQGLRVPSHPEYASSWRQVGSPTRNPQPGDYGIKRHNYRTGAYVPTGQSGSHVTMVSKVYPDGSMDIVGGNQGRGGMQTIEHVGRGYLQDYDFRTLRGNDYASLGFSRF